MGWQARRRQNQISRAARVAAAQADKAARIDAASADHVARIDALTAAGRTNWFALLAYLAFVTVTTLGVEDIDFFVDSRQTELPLVGVSIPTFSFFIFAPILGAALYAYLHLHIRKVTEALAEAPAGDLPLEERIKPWLLNDYVLRRRADLAIRRRPLDGLARLTTLLLIWWAGPLVLILMWERTWVAHDLWLSSLNAVCVMVGVYAGVLSWRKMHADVLGRAPRAGLATVLVAVLCVPVGWLTAANSKGIWEWRVVPSKLTEDVDRRSTGQIEAWSQTRLSHEAMPLGERASTWLWDRASALAKLDPPDLSGLPLAVLPPEHADIDTARHRYRAEFCERHGIELAVCGRTESGSYAASQYVIGARREWCRRADYPDEQHFGSKETCADFFRGFEREFHREWSVFRSALIGSVDRPDFSGRDLRGADLTHAGLTGIQLRDVRLEGADLRFAQIEGADLRFARMDKARLSFARIEGADLGDAAMNETILRGAQLDGANLHGVRMAGADLSSTQLERANLSFARMERANLRLAKMTGANLSFVQMEQANVRFARMEGIDLRFAEIRGADLRSTHIVGADLRYADMEGVVLRLAWIVGTDLRHTNLKTANWAGSSLGTLPVQSADLRGGQNLDQPKLSAMVGDARTLLPVIPDTIAGEELFVSSCWPEPQYGWDRLVEALAITNTGDRGEIEAEMRDRFLCPPGEVPQKTGTPWPLDQPPPWETDPNWQPEDRGPVEP